MLQIEDLRITFPGTGTPHGVPMMGCACPWCRSTAPRDTRLRPSIFVEADAGAHVLVDAGPDLRAQALRHGIRRVDAILFTHSHADHILGIDDVRRFNAIMKGPMPCYADAETLGDIRKTFHYVFDPLTPKGGGLPSLELRRIEGPLRIGGLVVPPSPLFRRVPHLLGFRPQRVAHTSRC